MDYKIWHKDAFRVGQLKLIGSHASIDIRTTWGGGREGGGGRNHRFLSICLFVEMKMSNFSTFRSTISVTPLEGPQGDKKI